MERLALTCLADYNNFLDGLGEGYEGIEGKYGDRSFPPTAYPCVMLYKTPDRGERSKDTIDTEFVYLSDFPVTMSSLFPTQTHMTDEDFAMMDSSPIVAAMVADNLARSVK